MRRGRGAAIGEFLNRLAEGDPVAVGFVVGFLVLGLIAFLFVLKVRRNLRKDDEAWAKKHGRRPPQ
jgi:hypothetical protein